ncbi:hypothetical protein [Paraoerskovia marina]|uniref:hypothetical protein n=1 Tax=Paraoerskovia marina TaxID=545619 RepID=UPI000492A2C9|nr:hypothetical protein [Paraoerskovia marina]
MTGAETAIVVIAVVAVLTWVGVVAATRLDRIHRKVVASRLALDAQLVRRAAVATELAGSGVLDPASSLLVAEAASAVTQDAEDARNELALALPDLDEESVRSVRAGLNGSVAESRVRAESELSELLRTALGDPDEIRALAEDPDAAPLIHALGAAWYRAQLARRFHNMAVAHARQYRRHWSVRLLRLAGHAPMPVTVDLDDALPDGLDHGSVSVVGG